MSEVTKAFEQDYKTRYAEEVAKIAQQGGEKDRIDTAEELEALRELPQKLANQAGISRREMGYILEQAPKDLEKTVEKAVKDAGNKGRVSDDARNTVKNFKNDVTPNKELDNKVEAEKLIQQIKDNGETYAWNDQEIEYFKMELIKAGYGDLLKEKLMQGTSAPVESKAGSEEAADAVPKNEQDGKGGVSAEPGEQAPADEPVEYNIPPEETGETEEPVDKEPGMTKEPPKKPRNKFDPIDNGKASPAPKIKYEPSPWDEEPGPEPGDTSEPVTTYQISEDDKVEGIRLADDILEEINSNYAYNGKIDNALKAVNERNAYHFIGSFINSPNHQGLAYEVLGKISDLTNKLSFTDITHVTDALLTQAKGLGLEQDEAYMQLKMKTDEIKTYTKKNKNYDGKKDEQMYVDTLIENLYNKMSEKIG